MSKAASSSAAFFVFASCARRKKRPDSGRCAVWFKKFSRPSEDILARTFGCGYSVSELPKSL